MQSNLLLDYNQALAAMALFPMGVEELLKYRPDGGVLRGDKAFIAVRDGVLIIARDRSYKHFIPNAKYDDINTDEL